MMPKLPLFDAFVVLIAISFLCGCGAEVPKKSPRSNAEAPTVETLASDVDLATPIAKPGGALPIVPHPQDVVDVPWLSDRRDRQLATRDSFSVFCDFKFQDMITESGITFEHASVKYASKANVAAHYDHGNGVAVADVDNDGLLDLFFSTQMGGNQLWRNKGGGKFENVTTSQLALADEVGVSASFADTDNDGDPDLYVTCVRGDGNRFFENDGAGRFVDRTPHSQLSYVGHSSSGVFFDYDRDGLLDLFLCNVGKYTQDEADENGVHPPLADAFAGHLKPNERSERSILYHNDGDNVFRDVTDDLGLVDANWAGDASPIDVNQDGWPDLFVLNMQGNDEYYENVGGKRFEKRSRQVFPKTSWGAMGVKVFDFDNDGNSDIYVTDMHSDMSKPTDRSMEKQKSVMTWPPAFLQTQGSSIFGNSFFHNQGNGQFTEISDDIGAENYWPWGLSVGDLNADGFEDVFVAASMNYPYRYCVNKVLLNSRGKTFRDSEFILGVEPRKNGRTAKAYFKLDPSGADKSHQLVKQLSITEPVEIWGALGTRSSALCDLDNDGDIDIITNEFNDSPMVLTSNLSQKKRVHWLKIRLQGTKSNRDGVGATVWVHTANKTLPRYNEGRSGYLSQSVCPLYFGLGDATMVEKVVVKWPSGGTQTFDGPIDSNQQIVLVERN